MANDFHLYSINWSPNEIAFMVDNEVIYRYNPANKNANTWPFDLEQYLILNIAMGGFAGTIDAGFTESKMVIDYVRVYQNAQLSTADFELTKAAVYPNPTSTVLDIAPDLGIKKVEVINLLGQVVLQSNTSGTHIDVSTLPKGVYLINLFSDHSTHTARFVKN